MTWGTLLATAVLTTAPTTPPAAAARPLPPPRPLLATAAPARSVPAAPAAAPPAPGATPTSTAVNGDDDPILEYVTDPLSDSVVRVHVSSQEVDIDAPWRKKGVELHQAAGVVVAGGRILVTALAVQDATFIEMSRVGESRRYELTPVFVDQEVNLALLAPTEPLLATRLVPLDPGRLLPARAEAEAVTWQGGQLVRTKVRIADITMRKARTSAYDVASYTLDAALPATSVSLPLVRFGKLVGLVDQSDDNGSYVIPASIIRHFLDDGVIPPMAYKGFAGIGLDTAPLVSPDARAYFHAQSATGGVRIVNVPPGSPCADVVKPDDVLVKVDSYELDDYGRYRHPFWGRVSFRYLLNERHAGDKATLSLLRAGKALQATVTLARFSSGRNLERPPPLAGAPPYLLIGGLLLMELDRPYLESWGSARPGTAPIELVHAAKRAAAGAAPGSVVLSRVLADEINQGFEDLASRLVDTINSREIHSLADAAAALATPTMRRGKAYLVIALAGDGGQVILPYAGLAVASGRIAAKYGVSESYFSPPAGF